MDQRYFYLTKNIPIVRSGDLDHEEVKRVNHNDDYFTFGRVDQSLHGKKKISKIYLYLINKY